MGFWQSLRRIALKSDKIKGIWGILLDHSRFRGHSPVSRAVIPVLPAHKNPVSHILGRTKLRLLGCPGSAAPGVGCPVFGRFRHYFRIFLLLNYFWSSKNKLFIKLENIFNIISTVKQLTIKNLHHSLSQYLIINKSL